MNEATTRPLDSLSIEIRERSQVAVARLRAKRLARELRFDESVWGRLALVVTEAATNVWLHGGGGEILLTSGLEGGHRWIEMLAIDQGPGIAKVGKALAGGHSTRNGLGQGLGAMQRLSDRFEIYAPPGQGTAVVCRLYADKGPEGDPEDLGGPSWPNLGASSRPRRHETVSGDLWGYRGLPGGGGLLLVVDGLGHGPRAHEAAGRALDFLPAIGRTTPAALMASIHGGLSDTRGAAALAIHLDPEAGELVACGIGNIAATRITPEERRGVVSLDGTLGHGSARFQDFRYEWPEGSLLVVHSDGISSRWDLRDYAGLRLRHPSIVAGVLFRDHAYHHDDATIVVFRRPRPSRLTRLRSTPTQP